MQTVATLKTNPSATSPGLIDCFLISTAQLVNVSPDVLRPQSPSVVFSDTTIGAPVVVGLRDGVLQRQGAGIILRLTI